MDSENKTIKLGLVPLIGPHYIDGLQNDWRIQDAATRFRALNQCAEAWGLPLAKAAQILDGKVLEYEEQHLLIELAPLGGRPVWVEFQEAIEAATNTEVYE